MDAAGNTVERELVTSIFLNAGITINGSRPYDIQILDERAYKIFVRERRLGFGEAYVDKLWDCADLDGLILRLVQSKLHTYKIPLKMKIDLFLSRFLNRQSVHLAKSNISHHYDLNPRIFEIMAGPILDYSCDYWRGVNTLSEAQIQKMDLICQKLQLIPGDKLLDIGCGFGAFAKHAAKYYGAEVTGVTLSQEQAKRARELTNGLNVNIIYADYREIPAYNPNKIQFDKIVSIGMFEHVGHLNHRAFFEVASQQVKKNGLFVLHTMTLPVSYDVSPPDPFIEKYFFPAGYTPTLSEITNGFQNIFQLEHLENLSHFYSKTVNAWRENFKANWAEIQKLNPNYNERFFRSFNYWMACHFVGGLQRAYDVMHFILSPIGKTERYEFNVQHNQLRKHYEPAG